MEEKSIEEALLKILNDVLGGWPLLTGKPNAFESDIPELVKRTFIYTSQEFFSLTILPNPRNNSVNTLKVIKVHSR